MDNFTLCLSTKVLFGKGQIANIRHEIPDGSRVLVTYGRGSVFKNGVMDQVHSALKGFKTFEFGGIESNPHYETLIKALPIVKQEKIDFLLAVGGGSVLDGTKFIAAASKYYDQNNLWEILTTHGEKVKDCLPVASIMTIPATGSEMNDTGVISRVGTGDKLGFAAECLKPKFAVLDPSVTFSLPPRQTANGVVDAFVHVAEQYMTYPVRAQIPDRFSEAVFKTLMEEGPIALEKPDDYDARANIMWAATNGLNRILATGVPQDWVSHAIGHELTAMFGIDHGRTLAVVLPAVYEYEKESKKQKLAQFASRVLGKTGSDDELADVTINETRAFFEKMGTKTHLSDYGIGEDAIPKLVKKLEEHGQTGCGEHHDIGPKEMGEILRLAL